MSFHFEAKLAYIETFDAVADVLILHVGHLFIDVQEFSMYPDTCNTRRTIFQATDNVHKFRNIWHSCRQEGAGLMGLFGMQHLHIVGNSKGVDTHAAKKTHNYIRQIRHDVYNRKKERASRRNKVAGNIKS